jgi:glycosyltransferase involved in cell wall biosynthesis
VQLTIIIPVFNEHRTIVHLIERLSYSGCADFEWIFVDDGSTDGTTELLRAHVPAHQRLIVQPRNQGKTAAVRAGLEAATGDWVIIQDADLEYDPGQIPFLLTVAVMSEAQPVAVYGQRPSCWQDPRRWIFAIGVLAVDIAIYGLHSGWVRDHATCYKLIPTEILRSLELESSGFEGCIEITAKLLNRRIPIVRVPISYQPRNRMDGKKLSWTYGFTALRSVWKFRKA